MTRARDWHLTDRDDGHTGRPVLAPYAHWRRPKTRDWRARCNYTIVATVVRLQPMRVRKFRHNDITVKVAFKALRRLVAVLNILRRAVPGSARRANTLFADVLLRREKGLPPQVPTVHFFSAFYMYFFQKWFVLVG